MADVLEIRTPTLARDTEVTRQATLAGRQGGFDEQERRSLVDALNAEARAIRRLDYERDRQLAERAFEIASEPNTSGEVYTLGIATSLSLLAHRNCILGELDLALSQASQALALIGEPRPSVVLGDLYDCIGWCHFCLGDFAEALDFLMRALDVADRIGDRSLKAYVLDSIGNVNTSANDARAGLESQRRALTLHRELSDRMGEALTLNNIAYTYLDLGLNREALASANTALRYAQEHNRHHLEMWVLDTLSDVYLHMSDADAAEACATRALELARRYDSPTDEANGLFALGRVARLRERCGEALETVEAALALVEPRGLSIRLYECHKFLSETHERCGDYRQALDHYKRFHEIEQAKIDQETASRLANLRVTHQVETARKDAEIHRLRSLALEQEVEERRVAQARLEAQASLDALTGLFNRGHLDVLAEDLRLNGVPHRPVSLMMFDIDEFKLINDAHGHLAGDRVLMAIARQLGANARESDIPCRYGGDEFLMLMVGTNAHSAKVVAERLRKRIAASLVPYDGAHIRTTISVGVSTAESGTPAELHSLIEQADRALYQAKNSGRDKVVIYRADAESG